jgi:hypothetical protein
MDQEVKNLLWDEYKYRHQHVWNTVFKLTAAVVLVSIVPYTNREVACVLGWLAVAPPAVASGLALFGQVRMKHELAILMTIRTEHRRLQRLIDATCDSFSKHVNGFLTLLSIAAVSNAIVVLLVWEPVVIITRGERRACFAAQPQTGQSRQTGMSIEKQRRRFAGNTTEVRDRFTVRR